MRRVLPRSRWSLCNSWRKMRGRQTSRKMPSSVTDVSLTHRTRNSFKLVIDSSPASVTRVRPTFSHRRFVSFPASGKPLSVKFVPSSHKSVSFGAAFKTASAASSISQSAKFSVSNRGHCAKSVRCSRRTWAFGIVRNSVDRLGTLNAVGGSLVRSLNVISLARRLPEISQQSSSVSARFERSSASRCSNCSFDGIEVQRELPVVPVRFADYTR